MTQSTRHETRFAGTAQRCEDLPTLSARLHTSVSLLVHVETVLATLRPGWPRSCAGRDPQSRLPEVSAEIGSATTTFRGNGNGDAEEHRRARRSFRATSEY
jgi:hypothetical protein